MEPDGYCRRMYFGTSRLMNLWHRWGLEQTFQLIPVEAEDRALDIGCSDGMLLLSLDRYAGLAAGIDLRLSFLKWARRFAPGCRVLHARGQSLPFRSSSFTRVFCLEVLEHVRDPGSIIDEIARVLAPEGLVVITVPIEIGPSLLLKRAATRLLRWRRTEQYSWSQIWQVGLCWSTRNVQHGTDHFGFDFRIVDRLFDQRFRMLRRTFFPVPALGSWLNLRAAFVARKR